MHLLNFSDTEKTNRGHEALVQSTPTSLHSSKLALMNLYYAQIAASKCAFDKPTFFKYAFSKVTILKMTTFKFNIANILAGRREIAECIRQIFCFIGK